MAEKPADGVVKPSLEKLKALQLAMDKIENQSTDKVVTVNTAIPIGAFVKHSIFGIGKVLETNIVNGNEKAEIDFGEKGVKSLLLKFAKLEVME